MELKLLNKPSVFAVKNIDTDELFVFQRNERNNNKFYYTRKGAEDALNRWKISQNDRSDFSNLEVVELKLSEA